MTESTRPPTAEGHFTSHDGVSLQYRIERGDGARIGVLVVHGFAEHGGRYRHLVGALVPRGAAVMTFDQRGHGHSGGRRVFVAQFSDYVDDLERAIEVAVRHLPAPLVVVGHSMGGLVALLAARKRPAAVTAWAVSNPALRNKVEVPAWKEGLARAASALWPGLAIPNGIPPEGISRDADEVRAYNADPLVEKTATARWYTEFVAAQADLVAQPAALDGVPLLIQVGDADPIIDPAATLAFAGRIGASAVVKTYPGLRHEIFNELAADRAAVLADLGDWLAARTAGAAS